MYVLRKFPCTPVRTDKQQAFILHQIRTSLQKDAHSFLQSSTLQSTIAGNSTHSETSLLRLRKKFMECDYIEHYLQRTITNKQTTELHP